MKNESTTSTTSSVRHLPFTSIHRVVLLFQKQQHQADDERNIMDSTTSLPEAVSSSGIDGDGQVVLKTIHSGNSTPLTASGTSNGRPGGAAGGGESHGDSHEVRMMKLNSL